MAVQLPFQPLFLLSLVNPGGNGGRWSRHVPDQDLRHHECDDALAVARAGADAIGLNFYPHSPRYISFDTARAIVAALPREIVKVGLFVNAPARGCLPNI